MPANASAPKLNEQICYTLYSTSNLVTQAYKTILEPLNLTYPQFVVMMSLWQKDKVSVTELATTIGLSKPTMTPLLKRLELLGCITRNYIEGDERKKCITLTDKGHEFAEKGKLIAEQAFCASGLTAKEADLLISLTGKIKTNLKLRR